MAGADRIAFQPGSRLGIVRATLNRTREARLLVDSGAERTTISVALARSLGIDLTHPLRRAPLYGVGQTTPIPIVRVTHVRVGASEASGLEVSVYDLPPLFQVDGLLGVDFLRRFRVTFEFDTGTLVLREPPRRG